MRISSAVRKVQPPPITEVKRWVADRVFPGDKPLVDLCQAIPSYAPPQGLISDLQHQLNDPQTFKYSPDEGLPEARSEVCAWYQRFYGAAPTPDNVCLTIGASQAFWLAVVGLCQPGDEVIIQIPAYFDHLMGLQSLGITPVCTTFRPERHGQPDLDEIAGLITPRTRALLLVSPSNPTGAVIPPEQIARLLDLARANRLMLILDETYNSFVGTPPHQLFAQKDWEENFIHIASFGKTFALTGLRCGALIAAGEFVEQALKLQDSMIVCSSRPAQQALIYGCRHLDQWVRDNAAMMRHRHDSFKDQFLAANTPFELVASGSFFAWIRHPWQGLTGRQAARRLADEQNLICLPGEAFGPGLEDYLRLAFGNLETDQISQAVGRFC